MRSHVLRLRQSGRQPSLRCRPAKPAPGLDGSALRAYRREVRQVMRDSHGSDVVQRENGDEPSAPEPRLELREPRLTLPRPQLTLTGDATLDHLRLLLSLTPQLIQPLTLANPNLFNLSVLPRSAPATPSTQPAPTTTPSAPTAPTVPATPATPSTAASSSSPSVPSSATLFSLGFFNARIVFEQPSVTLPPDVAERERRFREAVEPSEEPAGLDTGQLIKGLVTAFLTTTPPGQEILRALTSALSGGESSSGPSIDLNLDLIPTPILEGRPPTIMIGLGVRLP